MPRNASKNNWVFYGYLFIGECEKSYSMPIPIPKTDTTRYTSQQGNAGKLSFPIRRRLVRTSGSSRPYSAVLHEPTLREVISQGVRDRNR